MLWLKISAGVNSTDMDDCYHSGVQLRVRSTWQVEVCSSARCYYVLLLNAVCVATVVICVVVVVVVESPQAPEDDSQQR